jgi:hypothetical protein
MKEITLCIPEVDDIIKANFNEQTKLDEYCGTRYGVTEDSACEHILRGLDAGEELSFEELESAVGAARTLAQFNEELPVSLKVLTIFADRVVAMAREGSAKDIVTRFGLGAIHRDHFRKGDHAEAAAVYEALVEAGVSHDDAVSAVANAYLLSESSIKGYVTQARKGEFGVHFRMLRKIVTPEKAKEITQL